MVNLLLGSDLGMWALDRVSPRDVQLVFAAEDRIREAARERGFAVAYVPLKEYKWELSETALSVHYPEILNEAELSRFKHAYNLHPGYLPFGRGYYPVFWALWEGTPAGATLHVMSTEVDSGPIIERLEVAKKVRDSGGTLLRRVRRAEQELFQKYWPAIRDGRELESTVQAPGGTYHSKSEFMTLRERADISSMSGAEVLRLARALDVPGYPGLAVSDGDAVLRWRLVREGT